MTQDLLAMARGDGDAAAGGGSDLFEMAGFKPQPKKPAERTWGEAATDTVVQLAEGVNNIAGAVPNLIAPQSGVASFFRDNADHWRGEQSEALRRKVADADAQIAHANQDSIVEQAVAAAKAYGSDPALVARFVTTNLPSMLPGVAVAKAAQVARLAGGASAAVAAGSATTAAGVTNAVLNAGGARGEAFEDIRDALVKQGHSREDAERMALERSRLPAAVGAATGFLSGKIGLEHAVVGGGARGGLAAGTRSAAAELLGEQAEEVLPQVATNYQASDIDQRPFSRNVGRTAVETAIGSAPGAGVSGAMTALRRGDAAAKAEEGAPPAEAGTPAEDMLPDSLPEQPARPPGPAADVADTAAAVTRLAELEVIDGSVGLSAEQKAERAVLAERVERAAAREEELEAIGETPEEAAGAAAPQPEAAPAAEAAQPGDASAAGAPQGGSQLQQELRAVAQRSSGDTRRNAVELLARLEGGGMPAHVQRFVEREAADLVATARAAPAGPAEADGAAPDAAAAPAAPDRLTPQERQEFERAYRRPVADPLGELQDRVRAESVYTQDGDVAAAAAEAAQAFEPGAARAQTWPQFVAERGENVARLRRGSPAWDRLQNEWAAVKTKRAGTNPEGTGAVGAATPEIQNRDRARPASVVQMQGMAQSPDYMRLGPSRSPETGAPMVFAVGDQVHAAHAIGRSDTAVMSDGQRVPFQYAAMEAADVQPSNFADGGVNPLFDAAHPGTVKALNNGRTAGLRAAYERGTADSYRQELMADSALHGIDPQVIAGMRAPMLVRLYSERDNQTNMGAKSQSQALGLSAAEQAATDAALLDAGVLDVLESGDLAGAANRDFARAFVGKLQAEGQDVAGMLDAGGALSPAGVVRLQAALVHKAYSDGDLVESMFGSTDNDIRAIGEALKDVAGEWANLRQAAAAGAVNPQVDVTGNLLQAIRLVQKARRERASLYDAINQVDMVTGDVPDPMTVGVLRMLYSGQYLTRAVGRDRLIDSLREYMAAALATRAGGDMFGEQVGPDAILSALSGQPTPQTSNAASPQPSGQPAPAAPQGERGAPGRDPAGRRADEPGQQARRPEPDRAGPSPDENGGRRQGQDAQDPGGQPDGQGDRRAAEDGRGTVASDLELSSYTPREVTAREDAQQEAAQARAKADAKADADARAERERREVASRMEASAENFQLGQAPEDGITGQGSVFDQPAVAREPDRGYSPLNAYETDLFGDPVPAPQRKRPRGWLSAAPGGDVPAAAALPGDTPAPAGKYTVRTIIGRRGEEALGTNEVLTPAEAAQATAYLTRSAVERFDALVTDEAGTPLAVVGGFKGALTQASIYPATLVGEAIRVKGAARVWFSHNHPSGDPKLSKADRHLNELLTDVFRGSGIEPMGLMAVADDRYQWVSPTGRTDDSGSVPPPGRSVMVPVVEREQVREDVRREVVDSPAAARRIAKESHQAGGDGVLLLDSQMRVIGWLPVSDGMRGLLRNTGALASIYRAVSESNAGAAILVHDGSLDESTDELGGITTIGNNIAAALAKVDVRPLDSINVMTGRSAAEYGDDIASGPVFSRERKQSSSEANPADDFDVDAFLRTMEDTPAVPDEAKAQAVARTESAAAAVRSGWANGPEVVVAFDMADPKVPQQVRDADLSQRSRGAGGSPEGFYFGGKVYLLAEQLPREQDVARVLMHEALGHHGLAGVFGSGLDAVLQQLAQARPAEVRRKAAEYGLDYSDRAQRLQAAEEVLAEMAQARPELGFVQRAVAAVRSWARAHIPGFAALRMTDAEIVRDFIVPARGWVERGRQAVAVPAPAGGAPALAFSLPADALAQARAKWAGLVDQFVRGGLDETKTYEVLPSSTAVMKMLGLPDLPVHAGVHAMDALYNHGVKPSQMKRVLDELADPRMVMIWNRGRGGESSLNFVTSMSNAKGEPFIIALHPNKGTIKGRHHWMATVTEKQPSAILAMVRDGGAVYVGEGEIAGIDPKAMREAEQFAKEKRGKEARELKAVMASSHKLPNLVQRVLYAKDLEAFKGAQPPGTAMFSRAGGATQAAQPAQGLLARLQERVRQLTSPEAVDSWLYNWQDKFIDLKRIQDQIKALNGTVSETNDAYRGEELYHKRVAKRTANFLRDEVRPLLAAMNDAEVGMEEFERFLHARHAPEANRVLAERNPSKQELDQKRAEAAKTVADLRRQLQHARASGSVISGIQRSLGLAMAEADRWNSAEAFKGTEQDRLSLSGMSDAEAKNVMGGYSPEQRKVMDALATRVDRMNNITLQTLEQYGLMDRLSIESWRKTYQHYVPLHRDEARPDSTAHPIGQGFSTKGDASKRRTGSNEKVTNILGHLVMQREAALTRGEKNNVMKRLYVLAAQNPDETLWSLELPKKKAIDPDTGLVRTMPDIGARLRDNVLTLRIGGKDKHIIFNERNERAARLALAMKNLDATELDRFTRTMGHLTRWFAAVNTQYNPIFGVLNLARDVQGSLLQLSSTPLAGRQREVFKNIRSNMGAIYQDLRRERRESGGGQGPWARLWEQLQLDGGTTGYRDLYTKPEDRAAALRKALEQQGEGRAAGMARGVGEWLSDFNETLEASTRLAVYKAALDAGQSREAAASLAKNITVNFNRKGRNTSVVGSYYAFLNAAIQGNVRMLETLAGPVGRKVMAGGVALGMLSGLAGALIMGGGGADDEWKKIPDFVKERSIIIPLSRQDYVAIPMPLGFHVFPNIGRKLVEFGMHDDPTKNRAGHLADMAMIALNAYNPLGGADNIMQMLAPTPFDPVVALMENKDWTGRQIYKEQRSGLDPKPGHAMGKDSVTPPARWVARLINDASGGNEWQPGKWSPNPDALEYLFGQFTGGVGRELTKAGNMVTAAVTGEELAPHQITLAGRFYGNTRGVNGQSTSYYENLKRVNTSMAEAKGRVARGEEAEAVLLDVPLARVDGAANLLDKRVSDLVKMRRQIQAGGDPNKRELVKEVNAEIERNMYLLNKAVEDVLAEHRGG